MVTIKKISKNEIPPLVEMSYTGDDDLIEMYHHAETDFEGSVEATIKRINDVSKEYKLDYYKVMSDKKPIGFFVVSDGLLYSFALNINYRKKEILVSYWGKIKSILGAYFICVLYKKNARAIAWLLRCGMKISSTDKEFVTLKLAI